MAINPQIPLMARPQIDPTPGLGQLANAIQYTQQRDAKAAEAKEVSELRSLQINQIKQDLEEKGNLRKIKGAAVDALLLKPRLGDPQKTTEFLQQRITNLDALGRDSSDSRKLLETYQQNPALAAQELDQVISVAERLELIGRAPGSDTDWPQVGEIVGTISILGDDRGNLYVKEAGSKPGEFITGPAALDRIELERDREVEREINKARQKADVSVQEAIDKGLVKTRQEALDTAGESARTANRSRQTLGAAKQLAEAASLGQGARVKQLAASLFPDVDASNEAALESALTEAALNQLQKIKGPTTDFEFGVAERVTGKLADGRSAVVAKVNAAMRGVWVTERYAQQLAKALEEDPTMNPATFKFDFNEKIKIKNREFKLQDLLDTARRHHLTMEEVIERFNQ